jgi:hypothetical protein
MATATTEFTGLTLSLTEKEKAFLLTFLEQALRDKLVEVHRTEAFAARKVVQGQADILGNLIAKLQH